MSHLDPRLSKVVTAHSSIVAALNVIHSLRTHGLRRTLLFAVSGHAIPILGELLAIAAIRFGQILYQRRKVSPCDRIPEEERHREALHRKGPLSL